MGFYSQIIFPHLMNRALNKPVVAEHRKLALQEVSGDILEIGFGVGLSLPCYPVQVRKITALDSSVVMEKHAAGRIKASSISVDFHTLSSEELPFDDKSFDSVVSQWTLCSIGDLDSALTEVRRVLRPGGRFFFFEHGISPDPMVGFFQKSLRPFFRVFGEGCHPDRDMKGFVERAGFVIEKLENKYLEGMPKIGGYVYIGIGVKV